MAELDTTTPYWLWVWWGAGLFLIAVTAVLLLIPNRVMYLPHGDTWQHVYRRQKAKVAQQKIKRWLLFGLIASSVLTLLATGPTAATFALYALDTMEPTPRHALLFNGFVASILITSVAFLVLFVVMARVARSKPRLSKAERLAAKQEQKRLKTVRGVAVRLQKDIVKTLSRIGFVWVYERKGAMVKASKVKIGAIVYGHDAVYYRISKLPFRQTYARLLEADVVRDLSLSIGRECTFFSSHDMGVWLVVGLRSGIANIPRLFHWQSEIKAQSAIDLLPNGRFNIPIGIGENRKFHYADLRQLVHLLVAGASGGGKSVFLNQILCTLIERNTPQHLQLVLIDLKNGLEMSRYENIPHLRMPIVDNPDNVAACLQNILQEKERRGELLRTAGVRDMKAYNKATVKKLPYIVVFFDEIAALMLDSKLKANVETLVTYLAEQGRALGIHLVLCTQVPNKAVITTRIKSNIPCRIVFATDTTGSMLVIGNQKAAKIENVNGRAIFVNGLTHSEIQCPLITDEQIADVINATTETVNEEMTPEDLFKLALQKCDGNFSWRQIWKLANGAVSQGKVKAIASEYEGKTIAIDKCTYKLEKPIGGNSGRKLVKV